MKPSDFITEEHNIVQAVVEMHDDHEIQMAREQCYNAASNAIELHRMLKTISEREGLEGWVQEKITLASDYLRQVKEWMENSMMERMGAGPTNIPLEQVGETTSSGATSSGSIATSVKGNNPVIRRMREEEYDPVRSGEQARKKLKTPAFFRKGTGQQPATMGDIERSQQYRSSGQTLGQIVNKK